MSKSNTSLFILFLSILIIFFVALPFMGYFFERQTLLSHTVERLETLESNAIKLQDIEAEIFRREADFSKLDSAITSDPAVPSTLRFLQRLTSESGLFFASVGTFSTTSSSIGSHINETRINFSASGTYESFKNFLTALESSAKILDLESVSVSLSPVSETDLEPLATSFVFDITVKTFSY